MLVKKINLKIVFLLTPLLVLFAAIYLDSFSKLAYRFTTPDTYYSHGFLIPLVSFFLVWRKRRRLKELPLQPSLSGLFLLFSGLGLHILSSIFRVNFTSYLSMLLVIEGLILYLLGWNFAKELWFPVVFLAFMIPLPSVVIVGIAFKMKMIATQIAVFFTRLIGLNVSQKGSIVYYPGGSLIVGDPCSGLRSLISLLSLGALFTRFIEASLVKKWMVFLSGVPLAVISNVLRIVLLIVVAYIYGEEVALGRFHDFVGMLVFIFALSGLSLVAKGLRCGQKTETI